MESRVIIPTTRLGNCASTSQNNFNIIMCMGDVVKQYTLKVVSTMICKPFNALLDVFFGVGNTFEDLVNCCCNSIFIDPKCFFCVEGPNTAYTPSEEGIIHCFMPGSTDQTNNP